MKKLTAAQQRALKFAAVAGVKSTAFYADFGHRFATLGALQGRGLLVREVVRPGKYTWRITPAGRAALQEGE